MKVLVAASPFLEPRTINPCREGELVWLVDPCPDSLRNPDSDCSCASTFGGLETGGISAYARVVDAPDLTDESFAKLFWKLQGDRLDCTCSLRERMPHELVSQASAWPIGTVLRREGRRLRAQPSAASA